MFMLCIPLCLPSSSPTGWLTCVMFLYVHVLPWSSHSGFRCMHVSCSYLTRSSHYFLQVCHVSACSCVSKFAWHVCMVCMNDTSRPEAGRELPSKSSATLGALLALHVITLLRTYEEVNLGEDAVYEEVGDHVHPPGNRPQTGKPNQQTRKARKCNAHYRGIRAPMHPRGTLENDQGDTLPGKPKLLYIFIGWELTRKNNSTITSSWLGCKMTSWLG